MSSAKDNRSCVDSFHFWSSQPIFLLPLQLFQSSEGPSPIATASWQQTLQQHQYREEAQIDHYHIGYLQPHALWLPWYQLAVMLILCQPYKKRCWSNSGEIVQTISLKERISHDFNYNPAYTYLESSIKEVDPDCNPLSRLPKHFGWHLSEFFSSPSV